MGDTALNMVLMGRRKAIFSKNSLFSCSGKPTLTKFYFGSKVGLKKSHIILEGYKF
jgi:hypothetical protein